MVRHIRLAGLAIAALLMPSMVAAQAPPPAEDYTPEPTTMDTGLGAS